MSRKAVGSGSDAKRSEGVEAPEEQETAPSSLVQRGNLRSRCCCWTKWQGMQKKKSVCSINFVDVPQVNKRAAQG